MNINSQWIFSRALPSPQNEMKELDRNKYLNRNTDNNNILQLDP